ncbi:hypothetical protein Tco_0318271 [Tanacetum coccineum]
MVRLVLVSEAKRASPIWSLVLDHWRLDVFGGWLHWEEKTGRSNFVSKPSVVGNWPSLGCRSTSISDEMLGWYTLQNFPSLKLEFDVIDVACEEYSQEVLGIFGNSESGNPTPISEPIIAKSSPSLTPFKGGDFILEEIKGYLASDSVPPGILSRSSLDKVNFSPHFLFPVGG